MFFQAASSCWLLVIVHSKDKNWFKMQVVLRNLLSLAVLAALLGSCCCDCNGLDYDSERSQRCALMYDLLEETLVSNRVNLYRLRDAFFSSNHRNPAWLRVQYVLNNGSDATFRIWSSSTANVLFLELLQSGLLTLLYNGTSAIDILLLVETCSAVPSVCAAKVAVMLLSVAVGIVWMLWANCRAMTLPPHPHADNCRCFRVKCCRSFLYSFAFFNVSHSICNLAATIIPTFLLATVYPVEVLSTAALVSAVAFCFVSVLAVLFSHKRTVNMSECRQAGSTLCNIVLLSIFLIAIVLIGILYSKTIRQSNDVLSVVLSFLPSALLAGGWVRKRKEAV